MSARVGPDYIPSASRPPGTCAKSTGDEHIGASREAMVRASVGSESGVGSAEGSATLGRNSLVSRHDIAGVWVALFSRRQRYRGC